MLINALLGAAALVQPLAPTCPIVIVENFSILQFDSGSATLSRSDRVVLDGWLAIVARRTHPTRFELTGHADRVGSREANQRLSFRRADAVRRYLTDRGVSGTLISVRAVGEDRGFEETADEVPEPMNRVVELLALADLREPSDAPRICPAN